MSAFGTSDARQKRLCDHLTNPDEERFLTGFLKLLGEESWTLLQVWRYWWPQRTLDYRPLMSVLPPKADIGGDGCDVRFVPIADIVTPRSNSAARQLTCSMSGNFQVLSNTAFCGPYNRNQGNYIFPCGV
jgi:hypothetical protein